MSKGHGYKKPCQVFSRKYILFLKNIQCVCLDIKLVTRNTKAKYQIFFLQLQTHGFIFLSVEIN